MRSSKALFWMSCVLLGSYLVASHDSVSGVWRYVVPVFLVGVTASIGWKWWSEARESRGGSCEEGP